MVRTQQNPLKDYRQLTTNLWRADSHLPDSIQLSNRKNSRSNKNVFCFSLR